MSRSALEMVLVELDSMLYPEEYPPGRYGHDPDHVYWRHCDVSNPDAVAEWIEEPWGWDSDTAPMVADWVKEKLNEVSHR